MTLKALYNFIKDRVAETHPDVFFALWNNQLSNLEKNKAFKFPAFFIEFGLAEFKNGLDGYDQWGEVPFTIHILIPDLESEKNINIFDLSESLYNSLHGMHKITRLSEEPDHDHDNLLHWKVNFSTNILEYQLPKSDHTITDLDVTLKTN